MSQLRLSSHSLYVEKGRYTRQRIDRSQRYLLFVIAMITKTNSILLLNAQYMNIKYMEKWYQTL